MFNTLTLESFDAFLEKLKHFDYYYSYSDDINVYRRGKAEDGEIKKICENPQFESVYKAWEASYVEQDPMRKKIFEACLNAIRNRLTKEVSVNTKQPLQVVKDETVPFTKALDYLTNIDHAKDYLIIRAKDAAKLYPLLVWQSSNKDDTVFVKIYGVRIIKVFTELDVCAGRIIIDDVPIAYQHENCLIAYLLSKYW